jgi:LPXTG-motif cell wall-anchored protein
LKINNQLTIESLRQITSNVTTLQQSDLDKNSSLQKINSDLNQLLKDKELETGLTGLFSFTQNPLSWIALIGIIALIGVGVVLYTNKKKKDSLY